MMFGGLLVPALPIQHLAKVGQCEGFAVGVTDLAEHGQGLLVIAASLLVAAQPAFSAAWSSRAVLPMPGSPRSTSTALSPSRAAVSSRSIASASTARSTSTETILYLQRPISGRQL